MNKVKGKSDLTEKEKTSLSFETKLWREFKSKCALSGRKCGDVLEELMKDWIKKVNK